MAFEKEIKEYEDLRGKYQTLIINKMDREEYIKYNEVLFSTHSCAIEGNSFSVDDTRELKEKGLGMIPAGKTLFEAFEMLDHFEAFEYMMQNTQHPLDENFLKEINRQVTSHTLSYRSPEAIPGEYTTRTWLQATRYLATTKNSSPEFPNCWNQQKKPLSPQPFIP